MGGRWCAQIAAVRLGARRARMGSEAELAVDNGAAQCTLGVVVGRLHAVVCGEAPQCRPGFEEVARHSAAAFVADALGGIGANDRLVAPLQRADRALQHTGDRRCAERPPTPRTRARTARGRARRTPSRAEWILADRGHGGEWARVFLVYPSDSERIWQGLANAVLDAPVAAVRTVAVGVACEVRVELTIEERTATVRSAWHYADIEDAPRLVTAFPTP